jgi:DNA-binding MarR family transcriptional regulator
MISMLSIVYSSSACLSSAIPALSWPGSRGAGKGETELVKDAMGIDIHGMPGHLIRRMHQASLAIFDSEMAKAGFDLTPVQFAALWVIANRPGLDQATLATTIAFDRATTGGVIDRLESKGLVRREIDATDRRARRLFAEVAGKALLVRVEPLVAQVQETMLQGLDAAEQASLMHLLNKALAAVSDVSRSKSAA